GTVDFDPGAGTTSLVSTGSTDVYVSKLNSAGDLVWAKKVGGSSGDQGNCITTDGSANVYIGGEFTGSATQDFDPGAGSVSLPYGGSGLEGFLLKLNSAGEYQWAKSLYGTSSTGADAIKGMHVDASNYVAATGYFTNGTVDFNPGAETSNLTAGAASNAFVLKWNQAVLQNQTITFSALAAKTFGDAPFSLTATASSGLAVSYNSSNTAVATVSGSTVTIVGAGTTTITASQSGNSGFNPAPDVQQTLTVNKANQTITFGALAAKTFGNANFALTATASSGLSVNYSSSNTAVATVSGNTVTIVGAGTTTITASQSGNANYNAAANVQQILTVNKANQTITFGALATKTYGDPDFTLSATANSGLPVTFGSSNAQIAFLNGSIVTIISGGSCTITASQAGNSNYNAASSVQQTLTVNKASQTITFNTLPSKIISDAPFSLTATSSSGLGVGYTSSNVNVATVSGSTATIVGAGTTTITAFVAATNEYNAASVDQVLTVTDP
ncbi:MAG TPA: hypothetical protein VKE92_00815, partial [Anaerolineales bacterium]|nr:hypothetical protein [Anaerolineales bacterium]